MAFDSSKLTVGTRGTLPDFVLYELSTPNGKSRGEVPAKTGSVIQPGDLVKADGSKVTAKADAGNVVGIALTAYSDTLFAGLTREGDIKIATIKGFAEVKDTIFAHNGVAAADKADFVTALAALGIDVVVCTPDAAF